MLRCMRAQTVPDSGGQRSKQETGKLAVYAHSCKYGSLYRYSTVRLRGTWDYMCTAPRQTAHRSDSTHQDAFCGHFETDFALA